MKVLTTSVLMGLFSFFSKGQSGNYQVDKSQIIICQNINFKTRNELVLEKLKKIFGATSDYYSKGEHGIICQVPTSSFGYYLVDYNLDTIAKLMGSEHLVKYYQDVLVKKTEVWERVNDKPTRVFYESIDPSELLKYLTYILNLKVDSTKYIWILESPGYHPEDDYKGLSCKFSTTHSNPKWDWEFNSEKKDYCKVTERYKDEAIEWIPLIEGKEIKGDKITLTAKKIFIDENMKELAILLKYLCEVAVEFNLELSKDNDG